MPAPKTGSLFQYCCFLSTFVPQKNGAIGCLNSFNINKASPCLKASQVLPLLNSDANFSPQPQHTLARDAALHHPALSRKRQPRSPHHLELTIPHRTIKQFSWKRRDTGDPTTLDSTWAPCRYSVHTWAAGSTSSVRFGCVIPPLLTPWTEYCK
ncbi:hypothetical protein J3458_002269 [Metarhizium acridum]|uniref:uncharacterized protein n=1 Tax=Metarhizium acridum TaxID=92637 RepID=UPI001C6B8E74|nr:hypothetical protein J3458_002269 [Metarhizium acridum]